MIKKKKYIEALYNIINYLDSPGMRINMPGDINNYIDIVKEEMKNDGSWDNFFNNDENKKGIKFKNRDGDLIALVYIEPNHWRMYKEEKFYGIRMIGNSPEYIGADFVGGGPLVSKGSNLNEFIEEINEQVKYIKLLDKINSFDIFTASL